MNEKFRDIDYREGRPGYGRAADDCGCGRGDGRDRDRDKDRDRGKGDRARMLKKVQQLNFMMIEAGLFLNNQCDCEAAKEAFCEYQRRHAEAKAEYEKCYGPLTYEGVDVKHDGWSWVYGPWPWEVEDC